MLSGVKVVSVKAVVSLVVMYRIFSARAGINHRIGRTIDHKLPGFVQLVAGNGFGPVQHNRIVTIFNSRYINRFIGRNAIAPGHVGQQGWFVIEEQPKLNRETQAW